MANIFREIPGRLQRGNFTQTNRYFISYNIALNEFFGDTSKIIGISILKIWNGTIMISGKKIKIWTGSIWQNKFSKVYNKNIWN